MCVAPHAGAWIEIDGSERDPERPESLPMRERGLKFVHEIALGSAKQSLPMRERGLKFQGQRHLKDRGDWSLPMRERGLKYAPQSVKE